MMFQLREDKPCGIKAFRKAFLANFWKSTGIFLLLVLFGVGTWLYLQRANQMAGLMQAAMTALCVALFLLLGFLASYVFPLNAFFQNGIWQTLQNALLMGVRHLPWSLLILGINLFPAAVLYFEREIFLRLLVAFLLILPGLQSFWIAGILRRIFEYYIPEA